jgi:hypothetical protein
MAGRDVNIHHYHFPTATAFAAIVVLVVLGGKAYTWNQKNEGDRSRSTPEKPTETKSQATPPVAPQPHTNPRTVVPRQKVKTPLISLTDGQRFALKQELEKLAGNRIRIVHVGSSPESTVLVEQLRDVFNKWDVELDNVGMVSATGVNFPNPSYITGPDMASPILRSVYSDFDRLGVDLRLVPDAYSGPGGAGPSPPVVIVVR